MGDKIFGDSLAETLLKAGIMSPAQLAQLRADEEREKELKRLKAIEDAKVDTANYEPTELQLAKFAQGFSFAIQAKNDKGFPKHSFTDALLIAVLYAEERQMSPRALMSSVIPYRRGVTELLKTNEGLKKLLFGFIEDLKEKKI